MGKSSWPCGAIVPGYYRDSTLKKLRPKNLRWTRWTRWPTRPTRPSPSDRGAVWYGTNVNVNEFVSVKFTVRTTPKR